MKTTAVKFQKVKYYLMLTAEVIDAYRTMPRALVAGYAYLVWDTVQWFQQIPTPSSQHAFLVSTVVGGAAAVFGLYVNSGKSWDRKTTNKEYYFETNHDGSSAGTQQPTQQQMYNYNQPTRRYQSQSLTGMNVEMNPNNGGAQGIQDTFETPPSGFMDGEVNN